VRDCEIDPVARQGPERATECDSQPRHGTFLTD
jgi:hypothetical protein